MVLSGARERPPTSTRRLVARRHWRLRLEPVRHSLEQRFLEVTARLDAPIRARSRREHGRRCRCSAPTSSSCARSAGRLIWALVLALRAGGRLFHGQGHPALLQSRQVRAGRRQALASPMACGCSRCSSARWPRSCRRGGRDRRCLGRRLSRSRRHRALATGAVRIARSRRPGDVLVGDGARLRARSDRHLRLRFQAADTEWRADPQRTRFHAAGHGRRVRRRRRVRVADDVQAGGDHRADRVAARGQPADRQHQLARERPQGAAEPGRSRISALSHRWAIAARP